MENNKEIITGANKLSMKALREKDRLEKEAALKQLCEARAIELLGSENELKLLSNANKGLWYLPICDSTDENTIEVMAIMKPIDMAILSYASTKVEDEGIMEYFRACLVACFLKGDEAILNDDNYTIPACFKIQKIIEGKKAYLLKR